MTKKEYFKPTTLIMYLQPECMLAGSGEITVNGNNAEVEIPNGEYNGVFNARHNSVWDED